MSPLVHIDGSTGEGGGQILRTSVALAALTGKAVEIVNIRAGRAKPGLQPQHLTAVRAAGQLCAAALEGDEVGSRRLLFTPGAPPQPHDWHFAIGTAGASPLVAQTTLLPLAHAAAPSTVTVTGGTHVPHAPPADYLEAVYLPALRRLGLEATFESPRHGFYPRGGGEVILRIPAPQRLRPVELMERGKLLSLRTYVLTSALPEHVQERGAAAIEKFMKGVRRPVEVVRREKPSPGPGAAVVLAAECEGGHAGFASIGRVGKPMEAVAEEPCREFMAWWKTEAPVDEHLADQLVLPAALAGGTSRWRTPRVTEHLRTVLWVVRQFLPVGAELEEHADGSGTVTVMAAPITAGI